MHGFRDKKLPNNVQHEFPSATEEQILTSLDVNKATGFDEMSAKYIRIAAPILARHLSRITNISFFKRNVNPDLRNMLR